MSTVLEDGNGQLALDLTERQELARCEAIIERGLTTFVEVGEALLEIRDDRLYRETHRTFEDYCRERWGMSRTFAYYMIDGAKVVSQLSTMVDTPLPNTERVARELAPLRDEPSLMREAWSEAVTEHGPTPTAAQVREYVEPRRNGNMAVHYSSATDEWATPQGFFDLVNAEFGFTLDVCALESSAKCSEYFTPEHDGLARRWVGKCWMNPPYGDVIGRWVAKAWQSAQDGATVVCLLPARVDTGWWWDYCRYGEVRFLRGRLKFGNADTSAPFPSALVVFGPDHPAKVVWWERNT